MMKTINDILYVFTSEYGWPLLDAWRVFRMRLAQLNVKLHHVCWYINYPEHTEQEIADYWGVDQTTVHAALTRLRRKLPGLHLDTTKQWGAPGIEHMQRIEFADSERVNDQEVIKF
jgi:hypothetical protein